MDLKPLDLQFIHSEFRAVALEKQWQVYHNPKNIAAAVSVEASELLAEFQWLSAEESLHLDLNQRERVADEMADILMYLTELSVQLNIDLSVAAEKKIQKNKIKFINPKVDFDREAAE